MEKQFSSVMYTDGACKGNPGKGGWGARIESSGKVTEIFGGENPTTNNRMEMTAVIKALEVADTTGVVNIVSDSKYVIDGVTKYFDGWKQRGWKLASGKPVKNQDLWVQMDERINGLTIEWTWVRGHTGHIGNERADQLANQGVDSL